MRFIALMAEGTGEHCLFSWGANSYGQLGSGHKEDTLLPSKCLLQGGVDISRLRQITGGGGHSALLTDDGQVIVFGWNKNGQLGLPTCEDLTIPRHLVGLPEITKVSCGWNHTLAICDRGTVLAWGSNAFGQLGDPPIQRQSDRPVELSQQAAFRTHGEKSWRVEPRNEVFHGARVSDIAAGLRHSLAVTDEGLIFSWGDGKKGQLGFGREELKTQQIPKSLATLARWRCTNVAAGAYHSVAITGDGSLLSWGLNQHGQCGVGLLTEELKVEAEHFKLSETNWISNVYQPVRVKGLPPVAQVDCGWSHVLAISGSNLATTFGWNEHGMCGTGNETNMYSPLTVESLRDYETVLVGAGAGHCFVVARRLSTRNSPSS